MSWKKIITSGSDAELNKLNVKNSITASAYSGDGIDLINTGIYGKSGNVQTATTASLNGSFVISSETEINPGSEDPAIADWVFNTQSDLYGGIIYGFKVVRPAEVGYGFSGLINDQFSGIYYNTSVNSDDYGSNISIDLREYELGLNYKSSFVGDTNISMNATGLSLKYTHITTGSAEFKLVGTGTYYKGLESPYNAGIQYDSDYSSYYSNRSLVDKGYVQTLRTGSFNNMKHTGSMSISGSFKVRAVKSMFTGSVNITGTLTASVKSFKIPHQDLDGKQLVYGVSESPEHTVFFRGKLYDDNVINLPDEWRWLVDENSITVQLTSIDISQQLYVQKIENNKIFIGSTTNHILRCYYLVQAERKDIPKLINIQ